MEGLKFLPALKGAGEGDVVGVFQLGAEGKPPGKAGDLDAQRGDKLAQVHGGLLALKIGVGGEDDLRDRTVLQAAEQFSDSDIIGADAFGGRDGTVKHVIKPLVYAGMFQGQDVLGLFHDADLGTVSLDVAADGAGVGGGDIEADGAQAGLALDR